MKYEITLILLLFTKLIFGQNLIPNPNFTLPPNIKHDFTDLDSVNGWENSDSYYFSKKYIQDPNYRKCCLIIYRENVGIPLNEWGTESSENNGGYSLLTYYYKEKKYHKNDKIIQCRLLDTLKKGQLYKISFSVSIADFTSKQSSNCLGIAFTDYSTHDSRCKIINHPIYKKDFIPSKTNGWERIEFIYTATGEECFFNISTKYVPRKELVFSKKMSSNSDFKIYKKECNYYIGNVSIIPIDTNGKELCKLHNLKHENKIKYFTQKYIFQSETFFQNDTNLLTNNLSKLDNILDSLKNDNETHIKIICHMKSLKKYTVKYGNLSDKITYIQSNKLKKYFINQKIIANRIESLGWGVMITFLDYGTKNNRNYIEIILSNK